MCVAGPVSIVNLRTIRTNELVPVAASARTQDVLQSKAVSMAWLDSYVKLLLKVSADVAAGRVQIGLTESAESITLSDGTSRVTLIFSVVPVTDTSPTTHSLSLTGSDLSEWTWPTLSDEQQNDGTGTTPESSQN